MINRPPSKNLDDFAACRSDRESLYFLIGLAVLAPSSHNTQPWLFRMNGRTLELHGDPKLALPESDKDHRQFFISLGCALQNLLTAADYYGLPFNIETFPDLTRPNFVARLTFDNLQPRPERAAGHPATAILSRHANRNPFDLKPLPAECLQFLAALANGSEALVDVITEEQQRRAVATVVIAATETAFRDKGFTGELSHWIKPSFPRYREGMPGYNIGVPFPVSFIIPFAIGHLNVVAQQRKMVEAQLRGAPAYVVISTRDDSPAGWLLAGQLYEKAALWLAAHGLNTGPLAAPIQIGNHWRDLKAAVGTPLRPQIFFRLGHAQNVPTPSPRREIADVIMKG